MRLPDPSLELQPGHKVVVFVHHLVPGLDAEEVDKYLRMDDATLEAARAIPGHLGEEFASNDEGTIFMSYWENDEAVAQWARHPLHQEAKRLGNAVWYEAYRTMVCTVDHHRLKT